MKKLNRLLDFEIGLFSTLFRVYDITFQLKPICFVLFHVDIIIKTFVVEQTWQEESGCGN